MIISVRESIWSVGRPFPTWKSTARAQNWFSPLLLKLNEHKRARWTWARLEKLKHAEHLSLTLIFYTRESIHLKNLFIFGRRGWSEFANFTIWNFKWQARGAVNGQKTVFYLCYCWTQKGARAGLGGRRYWTTFSEGNYSKTAADYFLRRSGSITFRISKLCYPLALCPRPLTAFSDCFLEHMSRVPLLQKVVTWFVWFGSDLILRKFEFNEKDLSFFGRDLYVLA